MPHTSSVGCVIVAAGSGTRLGADRPKAFVELAGEPLLVHALRRVLSSGRVGHVVVVAPGQWLAESEQLARSAAPPGPTSGTGAPRVSVVAGGAERQDSVVAGLAALPDDVECVLVHDAARCLAPPTLVARVVDAVQSGHRAVVPGLPVADTIKQVTPSAVAAGSPRTAGEPEPVSATVDRAGLRIAQTPQGFDRATLQNAHTAARELTARALAPLTERFGASPTALAPLYTDDAEMAERVTDVVVVPGDEMAFKITSPHDLAYAQWVLARQGADLDR
jgi:2-C-methyl-D-erythritol 4-phosphate cytidylyltransferase